MLIFSSPKFSSWSLRAVEAAVWALGEAGAHFVQVTAQLGEHPAVLVLPVHPSQHHCPAAHLALGHVTPEQQRGDNQPGLFSGTFFFLRRNWLIKKPVWEKHTLPHDNSSEK